MAIDLKQKPIFEWPGAFTTERRVSPFRATYKQTLKVLESELSYLSARDIVLQVALRPEDFRLDGLPRANAKPYEHPGVILTFGSSRGALSFPCDTFTDWESNLRAIALSLEALRRVDRYGVTRRAEQYRGWTALPPPESNPGESFSSADEAAQYIVRSAGIQVASMNAESITMCYRAAAKRLHPDAGGSHDAFVRLQKAKELVDAHFAQRT